MCVSQHYIPYLSTVRKGLPYRSVTFMGLLVVSSSVSGGLQCPNQKVAGSTLLSASMQSLQTGFLKPKDTYPSTNVYSALA